MNEQNPLLPALTGAFSTPAGGNPTGAMVEAAYKHHGLVARYINSDVQPEALADAVAGAKAMGWIGFNCSLPHKESVIALLDGLADSARLVRAVNCVVPRNGSWIGENTDGQGFVASLRDVVDPAGQQVVILGAGGAARAIAVELALAGARALTIVNRTVEKAEAIAELVNRETPAKATARAWAGSYQVPSDATVLVNATAVGLAPDIHARLDLDMDTVGPGLVVCDVIPNPAETVLLREAGQRGALTLDGRGMLVNQAAINIKLWTGIDVERAVMRARLDEAIGGWRHPTGGGD